MRKLACGAGHRGLVARFGRLQDTVGDQLLPGVLAWLAEPVDPAIDHLAVPPRGGVAQALASLVRRAGGARSGAVGD